MEFLVGVEGIPDVVFIHLSSDYELSGSFGADIELALAHYLLDELVVWDFRSVYPAFEN